MRFTESERRVLADSLWNRYQELSGWIGGAGRHGLDVKTVCREEIDDIKRINRLMRRLERFDRISRSNLKGGDVSHYNSVYRDRKEHLESLGRVPVGQIKHRW
jgi:hypothetical protein